MDFTPEKIASYIGVMLFVFFAVVFLFGQFPTATSTKVTNESIAFAANDTFVALGHPTAFLVNPTPTLTWANGTTAVSNYTYTSSQVKIGANIEAGTYYGHYTYSTDKLFLGGSNYNWFYAAIFIVILAVVILWLLDTF